MGESQLDYWRHDQLLSEHHEHWHLVYPYVGRSNVTSASAGDLEVLFEQSEYLATHAEMEAALPSGLFTWSDRHGELFAYMHWQLLARYAAERASVGLSPVIPFDDLRVPVAEESASHAAITYKGEAIEATARPANTRLKDVRAKRFIGRPGARIRAQEVFRSRLLAATASGAAANRPASINELAEILEPTNRRFTNYFGAYHNDGHLLMAFHDSDPEKCGCMFWETTALRDPVFYRWHAHIDSIFQQYENSLLPHDFSDLPPVEVADLSVMPESGRLNEVRTRTGLAPNGDQFLAHEDFTFQISIVNKSHSELSATVRLFLAPEDTIDQRRAWIEMDKFHAMLRGSRRTAVRRQSIGSSVIRHPPITAHMLSGFEPWPDQTDIPEGCLCGWPYTLLLPRGRREGMSFRLVVVVSPGEDIRTHQHSVGGVSYCGMRDGTYPDIRPMGYPFDRPFQISLSDWIGLERQPQVLSTRLRIVHD